MPVVTGWIVQQNRHGTPEPEHRQCTSCGMTLSLNFFGLDAHECRRCEIKNRAQAEQSVVELSA